MLGNFQCQSILLIWIIVGHGPTELAIGGDGRRLDIFSHAYQTSLFSPCLKEKFDTDGNTILKSLYTPSHPPPPHTHTQKKQNTKYVMAFIRLVPHRGSFITKSLCIFTKRRRILSNLLSKPPFLMKLCGNET